MKNTHTLNYPLAQSQGNPTSRRFVAATYGARVLCARGCKADLEEYPHG